MKLKFVSRWILSGMMFALGMLLAQSTLGQSGPPELPPDTNSVPDTNIVVQPPPDQSEQFAADFAPWIVEDIPLPDGSPLTADGLESLSQSNLLVLSSNLFAYYAIQQAAVSNYVATNDIGLPASWTDSNGVFYAIDHLEDGVPAIKQTHNLESPQTVGAQKLWPGGSTGFNLTGTNVPIGHH
jgi:hypothetical protein